MGFLLRVLMSFVSLLVAGGVLVESLRRTLLVAATVFTVLKFLLVLGFFLLTLLILYVLLKDRQARQSNHSDQSLRR